MQTLLCPAELGQGGGGGRGLLRAALRLRNAAERERQQEGDVGVDTDAEAAIAVHRRLHLLLCLRRATANQLPRLWSVSIPQSRSFHSFGHFMLAQLWHNKVEVSVLTRSVGA